MQTTVAGAVAVRLRVYDSGLCFICAHLASGEAEGDELKRNYDYSEIVRRGQFPSDTASLDPDSDINGSSAPAGVPQVHKHSIPQAGAGAQLHLC